MKKAIISVTNDLASDKRVNKSAVALIKLGFDVLLFGRKLKNSPDLNGRAYKTLRIKLLFNKGPLFYAEFNLRLFLFLLLRKADLLLANDLDTLPANYLAFKFKNLKLRTTNHKLRTNLIYDCHEYFTGVPELANRKFVRNIWKKIENYCFPGIDDIITVNDSIAELYKMEYGKNLNVVRNITPECCISKIKSKKELGIPENKKIIILQGSGINVDRGAEELVEAMQFVNSAVLLIIGKGDAIPAVREMINDLFLQDKVFYIPQLPFEELLQYTLNADIGLSLDKDSNLNYKYSLPNKIFDYIYAGVPVLASPLVEIKKIINKYDIGDTIQNHEPKHIAAKINCMLNDSSKNALWKKNLKIAASDFNWNNEEKILLRIFEKYK